MKAYSCPVCGSQLFFENSVCVSCGSALGYARAQATIVAVNEDGSYLDAAGLVWHVCRNLNLSGCTWLAPLEGGQCVSCDLTRTRPADDDPAGLEGFITAERAKRHLVAELDALGLPVIGKDPALGGDPVNGLCFDMLSSTVQQVTIGHVEGVITIDLAEGDAVHREKVKDALDEAYRTMLGHLRHEIGHYYQWQLVGPDLLQRCRELFGDERVDYAEAIQRHYDRGAPPDWRESYLSGYATMHPWEDFAETWAHYLHICDSVETAGAYGLWPVRPLPSYRRFADLVSQVWIPLSTALNMMSRSIGKDDLYPFVLPAPVLDKLEFVASLGLGTRGWRNH